MPYSPHAVWRHAADVQVEACGLHSRIAKFSSTYQALIVKSLSEYSPQYMSVHIQAGDRLKMLKNSPFLGWVDS
jgi:hypothetical protein